MTAFILVPFLMINVAMAKEADVMAGETEWRKKRHERLSSEEGWLSLVALDWLKDGENVTKWGTFVLEKGKVSHKSDGQTKILKTDEAEKPDVVRMGEIRIYVIKRGDRFALRVKDPNSPIRKNFKGLDYYPPSVDYIATADFVPYAKPEKREIPTILGTTEFMEAPGLATFKLHGKEFSLEPVIEVPGDTELFWIFKDQTNGKETYPAGRFMYSPLPKAGKVTLNFNRAYNPPCAFTEFATCPLPPPKNWVKTRIEAGEKKFGAH